MTTSSGRADRGFQGLLAFAAALKLAVLALGMTWLWHTPWVAHAVVDIRGWIPFLERVQRGAIPYVDVAREYPVGAGIFYWLLAPLLPAENLRATTALHGVVMIGIDLACLVLFHRLASAIEPRRALVASLLFALNPTSLLLSPLRFEGVVVLFVLLGYAALREDRPIRATWFWAVGAWVKWFPAVLVAVAAYRDLVSRRHQRWLLAAATFGAVAVAINAPFMALDYHRFGNLDNWKYPYWFHANRPLYWDTVPGVAQLWLGALPFERHLSLLSLGLVLAAILVRPALSLEYKAVLACLAGLVFNRVYSPQFHLWFYPLLLFGMLHEDARRWRRLLVLFGLLDLVNVLVYPVAFPMAMGEVPLLPGAALAWPGAWTILFSLAVLARTVLVVALAVVLFEKPGSVDI